MGWNYRFLRIIALFLNILNVYHAILFMNANASSVIGINPNNWTITITSFQYNPHNKPSEWIDRTFGSKSVYYFPKNYYEILKDKPLTAEETLLRHDKVKHAFNLPPTGIWPSCSIEILAYANIDVSAPLTETYRQVAPSFGPAILRLLHLSRSITCYYRGLYENWRFHNPITQPNFWSVVIYCPVQNVSTCTKLEEQEYRTDYRPKTLRLLTFLEKAKWITTFKARFTSLHDIRLKSPIHAAKTQIPSAMTATTPPPSPPKIGICLAIPYTSNDPDKVMANRAILLDWVRYYLKLNFAIFIYDRDGANYASIFNNSRYTFPEELVKSNIAYFDFTIRGLLDLKNQGLQYDNAELSLMRVVGKKKDEDIFRKARFEMQGHDKTLTLTHCRFEAKAVFGIDNVAVADFDEFLYCPQGGPNPKTQAAYINSFVDYYRSIGVDQIAVPQRFIANLTASPRDCIINNANSANASIFDCLSPFYYYTGGHSIKSLHLGHKCPLTGYHQACPTNDVPRSYDCLCVSKKLRHILPWRGEAASNVGRECGFVHVSPVDSNYGKFEYLLSDMMKNKNEIGRIIDS